ncbi:MAG: 3-dehydroquinate synthase [Clostridiales bacterium]|jgi:3-dehydroquinate synthase|nr:3-dehydroquinate synthase [Clostridiales bacterium]
MKTVRVDLKENSYGVHIGRGILKNAGKIIRGIHPEGLCLVITDDIVEALYFQAVKTSLEAEGFSVLKYTFKNGEESKNLSVFADALEFAAKNELTRADLIVALGGGVVGDLAGFVASAYLRGIAYVQIPTTLLAAVDSSVGGKTGVDLKSGKNLAGAFFQPSAVICDCETLNTLPDTVLADGISECIKYGVIRDAGLFSIFANGLFSDAIIDCIERCVRIKAEIVRNDEFDRGERQLLNFGHTVGHAIEKLSDYRITHGHAVAIGMAVVSVSSEKSGLCGDCSQEIIQTLRKYNLPVSCPYDARSLAEAALSDKKRAGENITLVVPEKIGKCVLYSIPVSQLESFIQAGNRI